LGLIVLAGVEQPEDGAETLGGALGASLGPLPVEVASVRPGAIGLHLHVEAHFAASCWFVMVTGWVPAVGKQPMGDCLVSRTMSRHFEVRVSSVTDCSRILFASASAVLVCFFCSATRVFADSAWSSLTRAWVASS